MQCLSTQGSLKSDLRSGAARMPNNQLPAALAAVFQEDDAAAALPGVLEALRAEGLGIEAIIGALPEQLTSADTDTRQRAAWLLSRVREACD